MESNQNREKISSMSVPDDSGTLSQRDDRSFLLLSIFIGVISGLLVVSFRMCIEWLTLLLQGDDVAPHRIRLLLVPSLIGIVITILTRYVFPAVRGSGVNQTKAALYIHDGYISFRTTVGKFLVASLAIGGGFSLGPEDPSLQIGAGVASLVGRGTGLSRDRLRLLAPVGAAAGLAAAFNAPISAILFVIEEVIGRWTSIVLGAVVSSSVAAVVVARWYWGPEPMFHIPTVELRDPRELTAYAILGLIGGLAAFLFSKALGYLRPLLRRQRTSVQMFYPPLAGLLVGTIGYLGLPQVMGAGYGTIDQAIHGQFAIKMLLLLAVFKMIATTVSFSSGTPGGMFAPTLFIGAMVGTAVGSFEKLFFPSLTGSVSTYAVVGMGVLFAALLRAPLTSIFMVLEVSGNYSIIVPVLLANTIAYFVSRALQPLPVFELLTHQDGLHLPSMESERDETYLCLEDAITPAAVPILDGTNSISQTKELLERLPGFRSVPVLLVKCSGDRWYAATLEELQAALHPRGQQDDLQSVWVTLESRLGPERIPRIFPDQSLSSVLPYFRRWPLLAVSNRASHGALEGVLSQEDVIRRYHDSCM